MTLSEFQQHFSSNMTASHEYKPEDGGSNPPGSTIQGPETLGRSGKGCLKLL